MAYNPKSMPPIRDLGELRRYVEDELAEIAKQAAETTALDLRPIFVAPESPREGMIVYADGTSWDPGSGKGPYYFDGAAWQPMF